MAVTAVTLIETTIQDFPARTEGTKKFRVLVSNPPTDNAIDAKSANDGSMAVSAKGEAWDVNNPFLLCFNKDVEQESQDGQSFIVTCKFSTLTALEIAQFENPLDRPAVVSWSTAADTVLVDRSYDSGNALDEPVVNSAGMRFDPQPVTELKDHVAVITRNVAVVDHAGVDTYLDSVNSDEYSIDGRTVIIGTAWVSDIAHTPAYENGVHYYVQTISVQIRRDGWILYRLDDSLYELVDVAGDQTVKQIVDDDKVPITAPVWLDGAGQKIPHNDFSADPVYLGFKIKKTQAHAGMNLPQ